MAIDFKNYEGREQAFVKHTFLDKYLPALFGRIGSAFSEIVYVDGFAGPWQSAAGETFGDTSFGIALRHMTEQKRFFANKHRNVRFRAFLVEQDSKSFSELQEAVHQFPDVEVTPLHGRMEDHSAAIANAIPSNAFSFVLIDPKGFPEIDQIMALLARGNSEALVNFMFDFANRFADTNLISALEQWLTSVDGENWRENISGLSGGAREQAIETLAAEALRSKGNYAFAPVISVDKVRHDRPLYKLIFLSRHQDGLKVFRDSQDKALVAQANARSAVKAKDRATATAMDDLFGGTDTVPHDRSSLAMKTGQELATLELESLIQSSGDRGLSWLEIWPPILTKHVVTHSKLGRIANQMRREQRIAVPAWPNERTQIPKDNFRLFWRK
jgi:three-Cys-motif partner protein